MQGRFAVSRGRDGRAVSERSEVVDAGIRGQGERDDGDIELRLLLVRFQN